MRSSWIALLCLTVAGCPPEKPVILTAVTTAELPFEVVRCDEPTLRLNVSDAGVAGSTTTDCPGTQYIAFAGRSSSCPASVPTSSSRWTLSSTAGVCVYNFGRVAIPDEVAALSRAVGAPVAPDCAVVVPAAIAWDDVQTDVSVGMSGDWRGRDPVTVAVIDGPPTACSPAGTPGPACSHADVVARTIRRTACGDAASCPVVVRHYDAFGEDTVGPHSLGRLAGAIHAALDARREGERLILNLSLGWFHQDLRDQGAVAAVTNALALARCTGAIIISAAGNSVNGVDTDLPFFPGGYQRAPFGNAPFVYAVSADTADGRPFASTHALSNITALGFADDAQGRAWMGSSIATAVVSGVAAGVWSRDGTLTTDQVMQAVVDGATPTVGQGTLGAVGWMSSRGRGHVNMAGALAKAAGGTPVAIPLPAVNVPLVTSEPPLPAPAPGGTPPSMSPSSAKDLGLKPQPDVIRCRVCTCRPLDDGKFDVELETPPVEDGWHYAELVLKYSTGEPKRVQFTSHSDIASMSTAGGATFGGVCSDAQSNLIESGYIEVWTKWEIDSKKPGVRNEIVISRP